MSDNLSYYNSCTQCPRLCHANRANNKKGFCNETQALRIASASLHFGEEPLVTVFGGSGTIFFTGCTLRCAFCQNYQISQDGIGKEVSSDEFTSICLRLQKAGAENINLVTGSHHIPKIAYYLKNAKDAGVTLPFCWNSSAYELSETLELLKDVVSIWLPDIKTISPTLSDSLFSAKNYPEVAKSAISWMIDNFPLKIITTEKNNEKKEKIVQGVIVRHLFLPSRFEETADTLDWLKKNADTRAIISLMLQYTPVPFNENESQLIKRNKALSSIENRLVNKTEECDLRDLIEAYDFEYLFYQELSDDISWLPDFNCKHPFPNKLAKHIWHHSCGFLDE